MVHPNPHIRSRILVVDDEIMNRDLLGRILHHEFDVDCAENGQEALAMLRNTKYDVVLLDMMMPVLNGKDTLIQIRASADLAELPVIIVSAVSETSRMVDAIGLGANDYITKPLDVSLVKARVQTQVLLKRMMDERREAIDALESANQMKARMMQVASHDLRNPLNNLKMLLSLIKEGVEDNSEMHPLMQIADEGIETMLSIIEDFLSSTAVDNNGITVVLAETEGAAQLGHVIEQYGLAARTKRISLELDIEEALIVADERRLQQVFGNLLSNAIKYSPRNSRVLVRTIASNEVWRVEVYDSGPGIPPNERRHLFSPFSKNLISTQPTNGESSTGLGLWIAAEMMRLQGGKIGMDSPDTGGCCFWLELPLATEAVSY
jgi:two-component system, sensor histidine kinase and response regulator